MGGAYLGSEDSGVPIPAEATKIHGITDEMVKGALSWAVHGRSVVDMLDGVDIAGFNVKFDLEMIKASCERERIPFVFTGRILDAHRLWSVLEPRSLTDAARRWANYVNADPQVDKTWRYLLVSETEVRTATGSWPALRQLGS